MSTTAEETEKTTKPELLFDSLEIKGYHCFEKFNELDKRTV